MKFSKKKHSKSAIDLKHQQTNYSIVNKAFSVPVFLCLTLIIVLLSSCSKDDVPDTPAIPTVKDIYICGDVLESSGIYKIATYWKNGIATPLTDGTNDAFTSAITVIDDDIYVAGYDEPNGTKIPTYWKNGIATHLTTSSGIANDIIVVGDDIYVAGFSNNGATYWKNGIATPLTDGTLDSDASAITVVGDDVYVVGNKGKNDGMTKYVAMYWKNGIGTPLTDGSNHAFAIAITVVGDDVYITGNESNGTKHVAKYWKNGIATPLTDGTQSAGAGAITVVNDDVYIASTGGYWKNGIATPITKGGGFVGMTVVGDAVYVAGNKQKNTGHRVATYWKNGTAINFVPDAVFNSRAFDMFITTQ